ncbi:Protein of unknown function [Cotesia congregata]|uniref:SWIM-type domain-containing protein n=1 Tax=Cotesia congregata TaxID=51543 RepID=A0A8J2HCV5_COTCN|nr:Protein of unknown function [Cotesia congregata]
MLSEAAFRYLLANYKCKALQISPITLVTSVLDKILYPVVISFLNNNQQHCYEKIVHRKKNKFESREKFLNQICNKKLSNQKISYHLSIKKEHALIQTTRIEDYFLVAYFVTKTALHIIGWRRDESRKHPSYTLWLRQLYMSIIIFDIAGKIDHKYHDGSEVMSDLYPENRRLDPDYAERILDMMDVKANKKFLQAKIKSDTEKTVFIKDLHNLSKKRKKVTQENCLTMAADYLKDKGATVHILKKNLEFMGLSFYTPDMIKAMAAYPEIIFMDGTYKLIDTDLTVMIIIGMDSDEKSRIISVGLLVNEQYETVKWYLSTFIEENQQVIQKVNCVMTDKDSVERKVIAELLPHVKNYLCLFHTLQTFNREITCSKRNITGAEKEIAIRYVQQLAYSNSETQYNEIYNEFKNKVPKSVVDYFNTNWHNIRDQWTCYSMIEDTINNTTNNRLESLNGKGSKETDTNKTMFNNFFKCSTDEDLDEYMRDYRNYLTEAGFKHLRQEIGGSPQVNLVNIDLENKESYIHSKAEIIMITVNTCQCKFHRSLKLPCKHILALREKCNLSLFSESLCNDRWTKTYYKQKMLPTNQTSDICDCNDKRTKITNIENTAASNQKHTENQNNLRELDEIKIPKKTKGRGRAKGKSTSVIGLPKQSTAKDNSKNVYKIASSKPTIISNELFTSNLKIKQNQLNNDSPSTLNNEIDNIQENILHEVGLKEWIKQFLDDTKK